MTPRLLGRLAAAADLVARARAAALLARPRAYLDRLLSRPVHPEAARRLRQAHEALKVQEGDRWALACELEAMRAEGVPQRKVITALLACGVCDGTRSGVAARRRCAEKERDERRKWRVATRQAPIRQRSG